MGPQVVTVAEPGQAAGPKQGTGHCTCTMYMQLLLANLHWVHMGEMLYMYRFAMIVINSVINSVFKSILLLLMLNLLIV